MKSKKIFEELIDVGKNLGIKIIQDKGNFKGGYCLLEEEKIIVLNKLKPLEFHIKSLITIYSQRDISKIYIKPIIRNMIENNNKT